MKRGKNYITIVLALFFLSCKKGPGENTPLTPDPNLTLLSATVNGQPAGNSTIVNRTPVIKFSFSTKIDRGTVNSNLSLNSSSGTAVPVSISFENNDTTIVVQPASTLNALTRYSASINTALRSATGKLLQSAYSLDFMTVMDSSDKFPLITDTALLQLVQEQTFKYFWDFAHPVSGLARERNTSGETVTSGGSGFGIMALITGIQRGFITRTEGLARMQTIVSFLKNTAQKFKGAFPHWLNGTNGTVIPFSANDNGADLVETSYLIMGLLTARQYFNGSDAAETALRNDINQIWNGVDWDGFRQGKNVLYWHWSPDKAFAMNIPIQGWNECLITYVLAASSITHAITKEVYDSGFARKGAMVNNKSFYGYQLPLGPDYGGPLFFAHYSFMGINPKDLSDVYASYQTQTINHTKINYEYCKANPNKWYGYSDQCWGLTASDIPNGYTASSPANDVGVIAPTAALSSFPYTPAESMKALKFFYYKLGDKLWGPYGFYDAFRLNDGWFANSYLAIDQGPIIAMIENYRSGLLWNLFMSCPEIKTGMKSLGFQSPFIN